MARSKELNLVLDSLEGFTSQVVIALTLESHAQLVKPASEGGTPRDTGFASANWVPSIAQPHTTTVGSPDAVSRSAATQGLIDVASNYRIEKGPAFVSNNVDYIQQLNAGSSQKAAAGFVQDAIAKAVSNVDRSGI